MSESHICLPLDIRTTDGTTDESDLAPTIAPVVSRKGKQRMIHHPLTPQESRQPPPTAPPGAIPIPTRAAPPPRTRTRKQRDRGTPEPCSPLKRPPRRLRSSKDDRADAKEVPLDITQKRRPGLRAFLRVAKAQDVHQPARRHAASPLPPILGSSRDGHPRHGARSEAGNKHILVIVDGASKILFTYPLTNKTAEKVAKKLREFLSTLGYPRLCAAT